MVEEISIEADVTKVQKALEGTSKSMKSIKRQVEGMAGRETVKVIKSGIRSTTQRRTGYLLSTYVYKVKKDGSGTVVFPRKIPRSDDDTTKRNLDFTKALMLSYGGNVGRKRKAQIMPRGFVQQGIAFAETKDWSDETNKIIEKELKKYWG